MAYQVTATAVTLDDLKGLSSVAGLFKCTAFYTISVDSVIAVPLLLV